MDSTATARKIRRRTEPAARCSRNKAQPAKKRTATAHTDAFLMHRFTAFWGITTSDWEQTEREFFNSLSNLCGLYQWQQPDVSKLSFPENIHWALQELREQFKSTALDCIIGQDKERRAALATVRTFNIGMTLYYIPVRPVWRMIQEKATESLTGVLRCIFSYLYHITEVTYFGKSGYLHNTYEYLQNMLDDDDGEDEAFHEIQQAELSTLREAGDGLLIHIERRFSEEQLREQLKQYRESEMYKPDAYQVCHDFFSFAKDYPKRSFRSGSSMILPYNGDYISTDQYLSFYWSSNDCFEDTLMEIVNADLQEIEGMDEPVSLQWFDKPQSKEQHPFDFETRLFSLLDRLIGLLNEYDHEKHQ